MELALLSAFGIVAAQYHRVTRSNRTIDDSPPGDDQKDDTVGVAPPHIQRQGQSQPLEGNIGINNSDPIHAPVGVRLLKTDGTTDPSHENQRFAEQFSHPEDPNAQVTEKPWMRIINAPYTPKEEVLKEDPTPQDIMGKNMRKTVNRIEAEFAKNTVPVTSEKQFDVPVEQIATGNGSNKGFHIGGAQDYIKSKFIANQQETIESEGGPRGYFSGAGKAHVPGEYKSVTQRSTLNHESTGPAFGVGVPQAFAAQHDFEITASHMEDWKLDDHAMKGSRAPVAASTYINKDSVAVSNDENLQVIETGLLTGASRFATGASGTRDAQIHVPLNRDSVAGFDDRVTPNFKIGKASSSTEQQIIRIKNAFVPEMSQNTAAIKKNQKAPINGNTTIKNTGIDTGAVSVGTSSRGLSLQAPKVPLDAFKTTDRSEVMGENISRVSLGASSAHPVQSSRSTGSKLTTTRLSDPVPTPLIKGGGGKQGTALHSSHEASDTSLAEIESTGGARSKTNLFKRPVNTDSLVETTLGKDRDNIERESKREPLLASFDRNLPIGLAKNPTGSIHSSGMKLSLKNEKSVNLVNTVGRKTEKSTLLGKKHAPGDFTKNRRLGDLLNKRMGTSSSAKKLLGNPYSKPAQKRLPSV